ncbi:MAG: ABC transporter ATP-binding protein [Devosia sp.]|jgi:peptide/nickel transport system ATP-binding protein|uniref:dipeptide ABC transporter ATP-binding protein n=1 Tax=unclassified Devosia TaxID=196773 RepID=UPI0019F57D5D|nr:MULTISPECIES: ABC transporter ATP-binding protein [unclassified Devosia]MBF0680949.1 ABC transporter ATP-binding protein [Devosia sp.]WEJ32611.1 ABC transporter ATP-binding protein [Devosia sp. SD17-2]
MTKPLVEISDLTISFGGRPALAGLSLAIEAGERFGIIGESGSGKSLTALAIAGLLPETAEVSGKIAFDGAPLPTDERVLARLRGKRVGMVFQEPMTALNPLLRVGEQIEEAMRLVSASTEPLAQLADLLAEVGLEPRHADRFPHQLSGGQRQRVMIAMALASKPDLMIADEPTSALDVITQRTVLDLILEICKRRHMTLLFISHDIRAVAALCERIAVLHRGKLVEMGPTHEVLQAPREAYTRKLVAATRVEARQRQDLATTQPILKVENLIRDFGRGWFQWGEQPLRAVNAVDFSIHEGECLALVGPSGCGKTTLGRIIVGLDTATSGRLEFQGKAYRGADLPAGLRADLSFVFQDPFSSFNPRLTIGQSLGEPLRLLPKMAPIERHARLEEAILSVGLEPAMLERYPHEFSGGQRQRLAIARAMVTRPRLVVLDEPVSALDVSVRGDVLDLLARLQADHNLTYLIISHDLDMIAAMADRVLVMEAGRIVEEGTPDALFAHPKHKLTQALMAARLPEIVA